MGKGDTLVGDEGEFGISEEGVELGDLLFDLRLLSLLMVSSQSRISLSEILGLLLPKQKRNKRAWRILEINCSKVKNVSYVLNF